MSLFAEGQFNHLLAVLPLDVMFRLLNTLELVDLKHGEVVCRPGLVSPYVYFPTSATITMLTLTEEGASAGIALIGNEGAVGIPQFLGSGATPSHAVVLSAGKCLRVDTQSLKEEVNRMGPVMNVLLRYTQALMTQLAQTAVCNRHHSINQQFCRWLLLSLDRVNGSTLKMTHDQFSDLLGVRREGITMAASKLQSDGLIKYARGHITVLDREGIEDLACECYSVVNKEYDRLVPKFLAG